MNEKILLQSEKYNVWVIFFPLYIVSGLLLDRLFWLIAEPGRFYMGWMFQLPGLIILGIWLVLLLYFFIGYNACELSITEHRVYGKAFWGKRVDLPFDSISAVGSGFKSIQVSTSSGTIKFYAIKNNAELHTKVNELLIRRQTASTKNEEATVNASGNDIEALKNYKKLLDEGVISAKEFEAKKKQLLGL